ncbi:MAG: AbrB/MazE/SpoVT family DNA-binding domain-containing protein, partial [Alphaproteobacteria bacterium]
SCSRQGEAAIAVLDMLDMPDRTIQDSRHTSQFVLFRKLAYMCVRHKRHIRWRKPMNHISKTHPSTDKAGMRGVHARVSETGRLSLPAEVRRKVGLEKGGMVHIEVVDGVIRIRTMKDVMKEIQALARSTGFADRASVADFSAFRAEERARESRAAAKDRK